MTKTNKKGKIGSQRLLQVAIALHSDLLDKALQEAGAITAAETVSWTSPLEKDQFKEFQDNASLEKIRVSNRLTYPLNKFWPSRGPSLGCNWHYKSWKANTIRSQSPYSRGCIARFWSITKINGVNRIEFRGGKKVLFPEKQFCLVGYFLPICKSAGPSIFFTKIKQYSKCSNLFEFYQRNRNGRARNRTRMGGCYKAAPRGAWTTKKLEKARYFSRIY